VAQQLAWSGFTCILADSRAHGESDGTYATFGYKEAPDVKSVWDKVKKNYPLANPELSVVGYSMGGAIALKALDDVPDIKRVVTMSTFDRLERVMRDQAQPIFSSLTKPMVLGVCASAKLRTGMNPARISPADCASRHAVPMLVIHGADDTFVSPAASEALAAAAKGPCERVLVPGKTHWSLFYDRDAPLQARIARFLAGK
jgi:alpha-beta hydrolase superfamily lysophospholipase